MLLSARLRRPRESAEWLGRRYVLKQRRVCSANLDDEGGGMEERRKLSILE
jgi:hypothetical protein